MENSDNAKTLQCSQYLPYPLILYVIISVIYIVYIVFSTPLCYNQIILIVCNVILVILISIILYYLCARGYHTTAWFIILFPYAFILLLFVCRYMSFITVPDRCS